MQAREEIQPLSDYDRFQAFQKSSSLSDKNIEVLPTSGRAIQGATSHHLGQNFSKMFNIQVEDIAGGNEKTFVYQNSWGITTRLIGVMIMLHGDDTGLILPPNIAPVQAIVIPCGISAKTAPEQKHKIFSECFNLVEKIRNSSGRIKVKGDLRNNRTVGWKYCHWELKGVPVRIELGPKEIANNEVMLVRRDTSEAQTVKADSVISKLTMLLNDIQNCLFERAKAKFDERTKLVENWNDFITEFNKNNLLLAPFCGEIECEDNIKADSASTNTSDEPGTLSMGAKSLCIPFEQPKLTTPLEDLTCVHTLCGKKPKFFTLFGRSY
ncbi:uncharacterized protein [Linepithema humile]|uniref:uncharacterized protein n=1 Tax=Linepithema humile TaxID=83485 RepID=UPI00351DCAB0